MFNLDYYEDKLSESGYRVLTISIEESKRRKHYYLGLEHVFYALTLVDEDLLNEISVQFNTRPGCRYWSVISG